MFDESLPLVRAFTENIYLKLILATIQTKSYVTLPAVSDVLHDKYCSLESDARREHIYKYV